MPETRDEKLATPSRFSATPSLGLTFAYVRTSTDAQLTRLQEDAMEQAGYDQIFHDAASGVCPARPGLQAMLEKLRRNDTVLVWRIDRLGRSMPELVALGAQLHRDGIELRSLTEPIDTRTPGGELFFHMLAAFAHYERRVMLERTEAGLRAARERGHLSGRPRRLSQEQVAKARALIDSGQTVAEVARLLGVAYSTLRDSISRRENE